jgi:glycosyltransferase involved in cell wall biosynthesis
VAEVVRDGESGFLVPPGDAAALAGRVAGLLDEPQGARAMGLVGREWVRARFNAERLVDDRTALYAELLEARGAPQGAG